MALRENIQLNYTSFEAFNYNNFYKCVSIVESVGLQKLGKDKATKKFPPPVSAEVP